MDRLLKPPAIHGEAQAGRRAKSVLKQIDQLKSKMSENRWELAELYSEAHEKAYHHEAGFVNFDEWIDQSNNDMGSREVRYHIRINNHAKTLGYTPKKDFTGIAISKLKAIFTLDPEEHSKDIKRLINDAADTSLKDIESAVREVKGVTEDEDMTFRNFYVLRNVAENIIDPAIEEAKLEAGSAENPETGEHEDISDGRALEYALTEFMQDPNRARHRIEEQIEEGSIYDAGDDDVPEETI